MSTSDAALPPDWLQSRVKEVNLSLYDKFNDRRNARRRRNDQQLPTLNTRSSTSLSRWKKAGKKVKILSAMNVFKVKGEQEQILVTNDSIFLGAK
jgi:hypothetical protein